MAIVSLYSDISCTSNMVNTRVEGSQCIRLWLDAVTKLAKAEQCEFISNAKNGASFRKLETTADGNSYVRIDVHCKEATVGISLDHPRQGRMQTFRHGVDMLELREIFRNPPVCAGYPTLSKKKKNNPVKGFAVGDRVNVQWGTNHHQVVATLTELGNDQTNNVKVLFDNGNFYRVDPNQISKFFPKPLIVPQGNCQSLKNEVKLQQRRLAREVQSLMKQIDDLNALSRVITEDHNRDSPVMGRRGHLECNHIPTSVSMGHRSHIEDSHSPTSSVCGTELSEGSGQFDLTHDYLNSIIHSEEATQQESDPFLPPFHHTIHMRSTLHPLRQRSILPPLDFPVIPSRH